MKPKAFAVINIIAGLFLTATTIGSMLLQITFGLFNGSIAQNFRHFSVFLFCLPFGTLISILLARTGFRYKNEETKLLSKTVLFMILLTAWVIVYIGWLFFSYRVEGDISGTISLSITGFIFISVCMLYLIAAIKQNKKISKGKPNESGSVATS